MASNGNLPSSMLTPVPPGRLEKHAAAAWNAGPGKAGCRLLGPVSGYRDIGSQRHFYALYRAGGNLAAVPGTSNHGLGRAVDLASPSHRAWIDRNGARYGWKKTEAMGEWWHVNYVGGYRPPPSPLRHLGRKQRAASNRLLYHRRERARQARTGKGPQFRRHDKHADHWRKQVEGMHGRARGREKAILGRVLRDRNGRL